MNWWCLSRLHPALSQPLVPCCSSQLFRFWQAGWKCGPGRAACGLLLSGAHHWRTLASCHAGSCHQGSAQALLASVTTSPASASTCSRIGSHSLSIAMIQCHQVQKTDWPCASVGSAYTHLPALKIRSLPPCLDWQGQRLIDLSLLAVLTNAADVAREKQTSDAPNMEQQQTADERVSGMCQRLRPSFCLVVRLGVHASNSALRCR